jgi:5-methylcytosine-specific restriction endonuclease McrA
VIRYENLNKSTKSCGCSRGLPIGESSFRSLISQYKKGAKARNLSYSLSKKRFKELTSSNCSYCNRPPMSIYGHNSYSKGIYTYNGIDRVNNNVGYTIKNSITCCKDCNYAKRDKTQKEFLEWIRLVYNNTQDIKL